MRFSADTPCVGICSTAIGDYVCRGCKRFNHEVISWNLYAEKQKQAIWARLEFLLKITMKDKLVIIDQNLLANFLDQKGFSFNAKHSSWYWLYIFLSKFNNLAQIDLNLMGVSVLPKFKQLKLSELRDLIDANFYLLSKNYYARYHNLSLAKNS